MKKWQHPIRSVRDEVYDISLSYQEREVLEQAYRQFFANLLPAERIELEMMLL
jgi:hypothetical protein